MDRVSGLKSNQIQGYKRYSNEIKDKLGSIDHLRQELRRLEKKYKKDENVIYVKGKGYTEEELFNMINYYTEHVTLPSKIPELNQDVMKEILIKSTPNTIKNMCLTNKNTNLICNSKQFWVEKFNQLPLPLSLPLSVNKWIKTYNKMLFNYNIANKLVDNIIKYKKFTRFAALETNIRKMTWFPKKIVDAVKKYKELPMGEIFNIENNRFEIGLEFADGEQEDIIVSMDKMEFIKYLTLLFYYHGEENDFELVENRKDDDDVEDYIELFYKDLISGNYVSDHFLDD